MRVLILSVTAGYGHHAAAQAVRDQLLSHGAEVNIVDLYQLISQPIQKTIDRGYLFASQRTPRLYRACYGAAEHHSQFFDFPHINVIQFINRFGVSKFMKMICDFDPNVILCTHVFAAQLMDEMKRQGKVLVPVIGIVTDYTIHPYWEDVPRIEYIVTASNLLSHAAVKRGISKERLLPFGIPIHPKFNQYINRHEAAQQLSLDSSRPILLLMGGSMGHCDSKKLISQLNSIPLPFQILAVCGKNKKQVHQLLKAKKQLTGQSDLYVYGFVDNVEVMMSAADCIITKPGGLTTSEALAKRLPMLLIDPLPGHEERNVEFFVNNGISSFITKTYPLDEAIVQFFQNSARLTVVREMMEAISQPNAAEILAEFVISLL